MDKWVSVVLWVCVGIGYPGTTAAQYYFYNDKYYDANLLIEAGSSAGVMNSLTDLGGRKGSGKAFVKDLNWRVSKPCFGFFLIASYKQVFAVRLETTWGNIGSYDSLLKKTEPDLTTRYGRNLGFRSSIADFQISAEVHPFFFKSYTNHQAPIVSPYLTAGAAYFKFNPQAVLNGEWYDLRPLCLEGQGFVEYPRNNPYSLHQFNIPLGFGFKYEICAVLAARIELIYHLLFTDYLDDVSTVYIDPTLFETYLPPQQALIAQKLYCRMQELQPSYVMREGVSRGDQSNNDAYVTMRVKFSWAFRSRR